MKFKCGRKDFANALKIVSKASISRTDSRFAGIYMKVSDDGMNLEVHANSTELAVATSIPVEASESGDVLVKRGFFSEMIGKLNYHEIEFSNQESEGLAQIKSGSAKFSIRTQNISGYPLVRKMTGTDGFCLDRDVFEKLVRKTAFSCAKDFSRPVFTGCYFTVKDGTASMVATNTHRMAIESCVVDIAESIDGIIIPSAALYEAVRIMKDSDAKPYVFLINGDLGTKMVGIDLGTSRMTSPLVAGKFPDVSKIIQISGSTTMTLKTDEFINAVERVSVISKNSEYNILRLELVSGNGLRIVSYNNEIGNAEETVPADITGEELKISFNANYILDALKVLNGAKATISFGGSLSPCKITDDDEGFLYVVTPIRTREAFSK